MTTSSEKPTALADAARAAKQSTKSRITNGAGDLFVRSGFHGTSMREVADRVGLRASSLYRHVKSKQELLLRVLERLMDDALDGARTAIAAGDEPRQCVRRLVRANIGLARPNETALLQSELKNLAPNYRRQIIRKQHEYRRLWLAVLDQGVEQGLFKIEDPKLAFFAVIGALNYVEHWFNPSGRLSRDEVAEIFGNWVLRSLGA
jgi:AcrR family transcriptional regulator